MSRLRLAEAEATSYGLRLRRAKSSERLRGVRHVLFEESPNASMPFGVEECADLDAVFLALLRFGLETGTS